VRPQSKSPFTPDYLVHLFNTTRWHYWISGFSNGTTINMLPMDALALPLLVVPPVPLVQAFTTFAGASRRKTEAQLDQSRTLAAARDALLPKLLSGEIRIKDAEKFVGDVA
jgi:type I restriction enzyme S subunit